MAGKTLDIDTILTPDNIAQAIALKWNEWDVLRSIWKSASKEIRQYVFATDTTQTSNSKLDWKNKTTYPKLTQIRDNLIANYEATLFPKRKWMSWEGGNMNDSNKAKRESIENYMKYVVSQPEFKKEVRKVLTDYVDDGNCFVTPEWIDERIEITDKNGNVTKQGYVGPTAKRISPIDITFNPIANTFNKSPKIVRVIWTMGEVKKMFEALSTEETKDTLDSLWNYLIDIRQKNAAALAAGSMTQKDGYLQMDGFGSYSQYLLSGFVELLFFTGDFYDMTADKLYNNWKFIVADRQKVISSEANPSYFAQAPIYHAGWRVRQDNLWAMSPLANIIGLQYRIDHLENMKADALDTIAYPVLKIKGYVEDFEYRPMERIICGDSGDVEVLAPALTMLQLDQEIERYVNAMEQMAGAPKEAMGFRNPGEKTMYEVQRLENAYNRIFQNKVAQFEEFVLEPLLNSMLEEARRKMDRTDISIFDSELNLETFMTLTPEDITGVGRLYPLAARNFAEKAEILQNLNTFANSSMYQDPGVRVHISGEALANMLEEFFNIQDYNIVQPYIQISEQADAMRMQQAAQEQVAQEAHTPSGLNPADSTQPFSPQQGGQQPGGPPGPGGFNAVPSMKPPLHVRSAKYNIAT